MTSTVVHSIGLLRLGEIPFDLKYRFTDSAGLPLDLTGWTVTTEIQRPDGTQITPPAAITEPAVGIVGRPWVGTMTAQIGRHSELIAVTNGTYTLVSDLIVWQVAGPQP